MQKLILNILFFTVSILCTHMSYSQEISLEDYKWKSRILVISSQDTNSEEVQSQIDELLTDTKALAERKLVLIISSPESTSVLGRNDEYRNNGALKLSETRSIYDQYRPIKSDPLTVLIGLDGTEKFRQYGFLKNKKLFVIIDGMPMRRAEIKNKNRN